MFAAPSTALMPRAGSLAPLLGLIRPHLPPRVIPPAAVEQMMRASGALFPAPGIGFEARLLGDASEVDLCIRMAPDDGSAEILTGRHPAYATSAALAADPLWQRLIRVGQLLWPKDEATAQPVVNRFGLEIDKADLDRVVPRPSIVFFDVTPADRTAQRSLTRTMLGSVLPPALGHPIPANQRDAILRAVVALEPWAPLRHFGVSLSRRDPAVRLVFWVQRPRLRTCLDALGFGDRAPAIFAATTAVGADLDAVALQVDVTSSVGPRIGIEFHADRAASWQTMFRALVDRRLCDADRAVALAAWQAAPPGVSLADAAIANRLPDDPARLGEAMPIRLLNHVKLSFTPESAVVAKVYLYAGFLWRTDPAAA